jgi:uncharacterized protein (DUF1697 family)
MKLYVALFRGINVGGNNKLPMKSLAGLLAELGAQGVKTYIQSGNVVFAHETEDTETLASQIQAAIKKAHGFEPRVYLLELADIEQAAAANPFPQAEAEPKTLHLYFLANKPKEPDLKALEALANGDEQFKLTDQVFYLFAPAGIGRSKLAERVDKALGVPTTARNWRTVSTILEMARQFEHEA